MTRAGQAMTQAALQHAGALGYAVAILGTSTQARGIYERMGFALVGTSRGYVLDGTYRGRTWPVAPANPK